MRLFDALLRPTYAQKLSLLMTLPLIVAGTAIAVLVGYQSRSLAERKAARYTRAGNEQSR